MARPLFFLKNVFGNLKFPNWKFCFFIFPGFYFSGFYFFSMDMEKY